MSNKNKPLVLWGGTDVDSSRYGEKRSMYAQEPDIMRDMREFNLAITATREGRPIVGVCRGAQLLCVHNKGSLFQHSVPHRQNHSVATKDGVFENVTAGHHQIMNPKGDFEILGWNPSPVKVWIKDNEIEELQDTAEVVWYPKTRCLAIQPHPEWAAEGDKFVAWINKIMVEKEIDYAF